MAKKNLYLVLDCETATLPFANEIAKTAKQKQNIAIAKPLIYDLGWVVCDTQGNIIKSASYLIQETFFVPNVFNTAHYRDKRPLYMEKLARKEIVVGTWADVTAELERDMRSVKMVSAYNACFDFKKAIPFTERYMTALYSNDYQRWEDNQRKACVNIANGTSESENPTYLEPWFEFRGEIYPIVDIWGLACDRLINIDRYRNYCLDNQLLTTSGTFFKTSAETSFQYLLKNYDFEEEHTALADALIETEILAKALRKGRIEPMIKEFPFRELGTTYDYVLTKRKKSIPVVYDFIADYLENCTKKSAYTTRLENILDMLGE